MVKKNGPRAFKYFVIVKTGCMSILIRIDISMFKSLYIIYIATVALLQIRQILNFKRQTGIIKLLRTNSISALFVLVKGENTFLVYF